MPLDLLPVRSDSAAANMATDFLMLQHYPQPAHARYRHYSWHRPAVTFGYGQKIHEVRTALGAETQDLELCRRPSGGGIVDHRDDWTYALVIPPKHDLGLARAAVSYAAVHEVLAQSLTGLGCPATLQPAEKPKVGSVPPGASVCFTQAEPSDVIHGSSGQKLAGAAQKRGKRGLLFQGSIDRKAVGAMDWDNFADQFVEGLAALLQETAHMVSAPEDWDETVDALAESYSSPEWIERR